MEAAVRKVLNDQAAAWNRNDLEGFMEGYAKGDHMVFTSGGEIRRGYDEAFARYQKAYPDLREAGVLTFDIEEITPLGPDAALVLGHYALDRSSLTPGGQRADRSTGVFTLVLRRTNAGWKIVHDHTSAKMSR